MPIPSAVQGTPSCYEISSTVQKMGLKGKLCSEFFGLHHLCLVHIRYWSLFELTGTLSCVFTCVYWEGCPRIHGSSMREKHDLQARSLDLENDKDKLCSPGRYAANFTGLTETYPE